MSKRVQHLLQLLLVFMTILLIQVLGSLKYFRVDLTAEKRYTLSGGTREVLEALETPVFVKVYLSGGLPIGFSRLEKASREILDEFKVIAGDNLQYKFVNPFEEKNAAARQNIFQDLHDKGLEPTNIKSHDEEGGASSKIIFPGALVSFADRELAVNLLKNNPGLPSEVNLNNSIEGLEYQFIRAIQQVSAREKPKIAFIEGHQELSEYQVADITRHLSTYYQIDRVAIHGHEGILDTYSLVIIAGPREKYSEADKFVLDQYIMNGGACLWALESVHVPTDSLSTLGHTMAFPFTTNLEDQLFKYGVRVNPVLIKDMQCALIPVNTAPRGATPDFAPVPWLYHPLFMPNQHHPISKNLNLVKGQYCNTIDTLKIPGISNTVLLRSSEYTRTLAAPIEINMNEVAEEPREREFQDPYQITGALLEGRFPSVFANRLIHGYTKKPGLFRETSVPTRMLVIADEDMIKNPTSKKPGGVMVEPLGFDRFTKRTYGNKAFITNAVHYLVDKSGLIQLRNRDIRMRLLDKVKTREEKTRYLLINTLLPIALVFVMAFSLIFYRKIKYQK
jgi:ABC-2 type transport system permease protein